jgi:hypothetical protein
MFSNLSVYFEKSTHIFSKIVAGYELINILLVENKSDCRIPHIHADHVYIIILVSIRIRTIRTILLLSIAHFSTNPALNNWPLEIFQMK